MLVVLQQPLSRGEYVKSFFKNSTRAIWRGVSPKFSTSGLSIADYNLYITFMRTVLAQIFKKGSRMRSALPTSSVHSSLPSTSSQFFLQNQMTLPECYFERVVNDGFFSPWVQKLTVIEYFIIWYQDRKKTPLWSATGYCAKGGNAVGISPVLDPMTSDL